MRVLISADLEGASGVVSAAEIGSGPVGRGSVDHQWAQRSLTGDINAAVEGAMEAGATSFVVHDSHGAGPGNILLEELHPAVEVVRGRRIVFFEEADLARGYDAAFLIGMHSRAGEAALFSQVLDCPLIGQVRLNGQPVGEAELAVALAGAYGIPAALVTGDDKVCLDLQRWSGGPIETAVVKLSLSRHAARCLPLIEARECIRTAAGRAISHLATMKPLSLSRTITLEVDLTDREVAGRVAWMPQVGYDGEHTVRYADKDLSKVYRAFLAMVWVASSGLNA